MIGSLLGIFIAQNIFNLTMIGYSASTVFYMIVGLTIGACECLFMPFYLAFPLGYLWGQLMIETGGMIVMVLPLALPAGLIALIISDFDCLIRPKEFDYFLETSNPDTTNVYN